MSNHAYTCYPHFINLQWTTKTCVVKTISNKILQNENLFKLFTLYFTIRFKFFVLRIMRYRNTDTTTNLEKFIFYINPIGNQTRGRRMN